jgi:hypothetical protein
VPRLALNWNEVDLLAKVAPGLREEFFEHPGHRHHSRAGGDRLTLDVDRPGLAAGSWRPLEDADRDPSTGEIEGAA